ncbi:hypothetical protein [Lachnoclostridium sp. Marseille-P6806]|uniref:hypothetical protein n=1 Tax=Lachnoclostridium sp. Marseille-P6806 TaxID=2364793 RepID=UPI0010316EFE|nr:hypothetical protein [Lachnoclostridium sp. Marseille-P6806]
MALSDEIREQRKSLKGKGLRAQLVWFWDYYRWQTVLVILGAVMIGSTAYSIATRKPEAASVIFLNVEDEAAMMENDAVTERMAEAAGIDLSKESVTLDMMSRITPGGARDQAEMAAQEKIFAYVAAKDLDVLAADAYNFESYVRAGAFADLRTVFSEEELAAFGSNLYYVERASLDGGQEELAAEESAAGSEAESAGGDSTTESAAETGDAGEAAAAGEDAAENPAYVFGALSPEAEAAAESEKVGVFELPDPADMEDPVPVGIMLNEAPYADEFSLYRDTAGLVGVLTTSEHTAAAAGIIGFLWGGPAQ